MTYIYGKYIRQIYMAKRYGIYIYIFSITFVLAVQILASIFNILPTEAKYIGQRYIFATSNRNKVPFPTNAIKRSKLISRKLRLPRIQNIWWTHIYIWIYIYIYIYEKRDDHPRVELFCLYVSKKIFTRPILTYGNSHLHGIIPTRKIPTIA